MGLVDFDYYEVKQYAVYLNLYLKLILIVVFMVMFKVVL